MVIQKIKTYFTSDLHLGHANVLNFCDRPWDNLDDMHEGLIKRYNSCVRKNDVCYFLGDVGMGNAEQLKSIISRLNGKKILILGNHDRGVVAMYNMGFDAVMYSSSLVIGQPT